MLKRSAFVLLLLGVLGTWPVFGLEFHGWRTDGQAVIGSSIGQQSSNQAFNLYDSLMDAANASFALYWTGELPDNGGVGSPLPFGSIPNTTTIQDNRIQEPDVSWSNWKPVVDKGNLPRPPFTPNIPQAWSPVVVDAENGANSADHILVGVSFEPMPPQGANVGIVSPDPREQILTAYYPQIQSGLPGNSTALGATDRGTVRPLWRTVGGGVGLRIADLAPLVAGGSRNNSSPTLGVVTHPPIYARVPARFAPNGNVTTNEVRRVVYLVVGTGEITATDVSGNETGDFARVICVSLDSRKDSNGDPVRGLPNPAQIPTTRPQKTFLPPDPGWCSADGTSGGEVMWSYQIGGRTKNPDGSFKPTPVAGISFANIGDSSDSRPVLYVTTKDGQILCLNAKAADAGDFTADGDPEIITGRDMTNDDQKYRWRFLTGQKTPGVGPAEIPGFLYGMAPAAVRVPLTNLFGPTPPTAAANTITNALTKQAVSEWMVFAADTFGTFWALEGPGVRVLANNRLDHYDARLRWQLDPPLTGAVPNQIPDFRRDTNNKRERFILPAMVYQGNTPLRAASGALISGSSDVGLDDEVIFASERGTIYAVDAVGKLKVDDSAVNGGPDDGLPMFLAMGSNPLIEPGTTLRWSWQPPKNNGDVVTDTDTHMFPNTDFEEPRVWPRTVPDSEAIANTPAAQFPLTPTDKKLIRNNLGSPIYLHDSLNNPDKDQFYMRGALGMVLGANTDPNGASPNLDTGDDSIVVPYLQEMDASVDQIEPQNGNQGQGQGQGAGATRTINRPAGYRWFYEYVGTLKPYPFVQASEPIAELESVTVDVLLPTGVKVPGVKVPLNHVRVGTVKGNGYPSNRVATITDTLGVSHGANPSFDANATLVPEDTVYFVRSSFWHDVSKEWVTIDPATTVLLRYKRPGQANAANDQVTTLPLSSCYRQVDLNPSTGDPTSPGKLRVIRCKASLSEANARLEGHRFIRRQFRASGPFSNVIEDEDPALVQASEFELTPLANNNPFSGDGFRQPAPMGAGSQNAGGTLMVPSMYRGRIIALSHRLRRQNAIMSAYDPRLDPAVQANAGPPRPNASTVPFPGGGQAVNHYGPSRVAGTVPAILLNTFDPGELFTPQAPLQNDPNYKVEESHDDFPAITDVGASVTLVDGWMYVTYRNGHTRAYSVVGGGASGTTGGSANPPLFNQPGTQTTVGTVVRAPVGISMQTSPTGGTIDMSTDAGLLLEYGQTIYVRIDFGDAQYLQPPQSTDSQSLNDYTQNGYPLGTLIDGQILENDVQGQIRSSNGAVQQLPGAQRGVRPTIEPASNHVVAVVPIFAGIPAASNPLTPGTPLLREREPLDTAGKANTYNSFDGEVTFDIQITQPGVQWYWPVRPKFADPASAPAPPNDPKVIDTTRQHYWETEKNQTVGGATVRYPTTGGTTNGAPNWTPPNSATPASYETGQWAPLVSYNNPIMLHYKPDLSDTGAVLGGAQIHGIPGPANNGINPIDIVGAVDQYTGADARLLPGRKNGDEYEKKYVDGAHSGSGRPVTPTVGVAYVNGLPRQVLFASHGQSSPAEATFRVNGQNLTLPSAGKLRLGDRSYLAAVGRGLPLRIQTAPLTKMGVGARFGNVNGNGLLANLDPTGPFGSFEQNAHSWDNAPDQLYPSIPQSRVAVTKVGTNADLVNSPVQVSGRWLDSATSTWKLPLPPAQANPQGATLMDAVAVQVDVPRYTADDIYSTRWRWADTIDPVTGQRGSSPLPFTSNSNAHGVFNPFFPSTANQVGAGRPYWDRAEKFARGPFGTLPKPAPGEDASIQGSGYTLPASNPYDPAVDANNQGELTATGQPNYYDDRLKRVVVYVDANNNGQLDLQPNYREAYRTFGVQVAVRPEMKLEIQQQTLDFGNLWHGKKQIGMGGGRLDIQEFQHMTLAAAGQAPFANPQEQSLARFYQQYWRPFNLLNTGNVNLAFVKPELVYRLGNSQPQYVALPSEGNDLWRALTLLSPVKTDQDDPSQIFLRTSFDDQLLPPAGNLPYGGTVTGLWLQKAVPGAGQPASVGYVDPSASPSGVPIARDPSFYQYKNVRDTWMTLNLPTGAALGQYSGSIRFFNDRAVAIVENPLDNNMPFGYAYGSPTGSAPNGALDRQAPVQNAPVPAGTPLEAVTDPPVRIRARVTENILLGRYATLDTSKPDPDRRVQPAAAPVLDQNGNLTRLLVAYASNKDSTGTTTSGVNPVSSVYDVFASALNLDTSQNRFLFPFDPVPSSRIDQGPWTDLGGANPGATAVTSGGLSNLHSSRPSLARDPAGATVLAWTQRFSAPQGSASAAADEYGVIYQGLLPAQTPQILLWPPGRSNDPVSQLSFLKTARSAANIVPVVDPNNGQINYLAIYALGSGVRRNLAFSAASQQTVTQTQQVTDTRWPARWPKTLGVGWSPENLLPTSASFSTVDDPKAFATIPTPRLPGPIPPYSQNVTEPQYIQAEKQALPAMAWTAFSGASTRMGRQDIYLSRFRIASLLSSAQRGGVNGVQGPDPLGKARDYGQVGFPRMELDVLRANPTRTLYTASGTDWLVAGYSPVQVYIALPNLPSAQNGSLLKPVPLIKVGISAPLSTSGEAIFPLDDALVGGNAQLRAARVVVDRAAGLVRFTMDTRSLARLLGLGSGQPNMPDPVILADYTPATLRLTRGDVSASDAVVVPVLSQAGQRPVVDASWYRQHIDPVNGTTTKWDAGLPVAGIADRLWVFWRRAAGAVSGGPTSFYKVLRPGIRVKAGAIYGIRTAELATNVGGANVFAEEVNPATGQIYFPYSYEGQRVQVRYLLPGGAQITEEHVVTWQDETGERPVPMEQAVNEGGVDAFATYEDLKPAELTDFSLQQTLGGQPARHMERIWLFWSSTRGSGGDLYYATIAPRIGPEVNLGAYSTLFTNPQSVAGLSPNQVRARAAAAASLEILRPFTLSGPARKSYVPAAGFQNPRRAGSGG